MSWPNSTLWQIGTPGDSIADVDICHHTVKYQNHLEK
jgi:hypothetical protein